MRPSRLVGVALAVLLALAGCAAQADRGFQARTDQVAAAIERLRAEGVDTPTVDHLSAQLRSIRDARVGPMPAAWLPAQLRGQDARVRDLLAGVAAAERSALAAGRAQVDAALGQLALADPGLPADELAAYRAREDRAATPAELGQLAVEVRTAATTAARQRQPALDLGPVAAALRDLESRASALRIDIGAASAAVATYQALLQLPARDVATRLPAVSAALHEATDALTAAIGRAEQAGPVAPPAPVERGRAVVIDLGAQFLYAYQDGAVILTTPVTTGRPALPTERGTFHVITKSSPYLFVSPWPRGSPYYYPPAWTTWAVEFIGDGTYLHDAPWQPDGTYGPGSQNGPYASHGCVHVPGAAMATLYGWLQRGDLVVVR